MLFRVVARLLILAFLCYVAHSQDAEFTATVNVGILMFDSATNTTTVTSIPQSFTVTENVDSGLLPVYLLAYNDTIVDNFQGIEITDDVIVYCDIVNEYSPGDTVVTFEDTILYKGNITGEVLYNVSTQGRAVEVQCTGEYVNTPGVVNNDLFNVTTSAGFPGSLPEPHLDHISPFIMRHC
ncbi:uncharacterized protein LOC102801297 [Saccoglossus kowalevskii]|uniref:Uncharacterized protein LOC102801297 n=1 Tax=Saccoglossus kowalevskii TaxID=10224 RepID=A0ABM0MJ10_SACKO|nr:PREDICTED: uncharacterized protein LOC102801297 [Saccoglossus kowalevskii]